MNPLEKLSIELALNSLSDDTGFVKGICKVCGKESDLLEGEYEICSNCYFA